ncbi:MAG: hypothetical protein NTU57_02655 [Candidatus Aenigmarchaeota archaeon]|nr:hypothetical protein [Candidatus Aenigmarchaeota archaeon]
MKPFNKLRIAMANKSEAIRQSVFSVLVNKLVNCGVPGSIGLVIGELVTGLVLIFVGIFMLNAVYVATALNNTSVFWNVQQQMIVTVGTVFSVIGLLLVIVALATAIGILRQSIAGA